MSFFLEKIKQSYTELKNKTVGSHELSTIYFKQFSTTFIIKGISVVISILYVPVVLGFLDQEKYGIWVTLTTIVNWIRVLDLGIGGGMRLKLSEAIALGQNQNGRVYISTTYGIIGGIFLFMLVIFYLVNPFLNWQNLLNTSIIAQTELIRLTTISVTFIVLGFVLQTINLVYLAHGNSAAGAFIQLFISSITLLLIWLASIYADKGNIILLSWIITGVPVLVYAIISLYAYLVKFPHFRPSLKLIKIKESGSLLRLSLQILVNSVTFMIIYGSIPFMIAHLFSPNEVTIFNIAYSIFNLPIMLIGLLAEPFNPLVTLAFAKNDNDWIKSMLGKLRKISYLIAFGTIIMILLSPLIYDIWIGDKVVIPIILSAAIGLYAIISVLQIPYSVFTNGTGRIRIFIYLSPISIGIYISLSIILSRLLDNVIGVAIALALTCLVGLIVLPIWLKKQFAVQST